MFVTRMSRPTDSPDDGSRRSPRRPLAIILAVVATVLGLFPGTADAATIHDPIGHLDTVKVTRSTISVVGWAIDRDTAHSIQVSITLDSRTVAVLRAGQARAGLAQHYKRFGITHGFSGAVSAANGWHTVCAVAMNISRGAPRTLGCAVVNVFVDHNPSGLLDNPKQTPAGILATGWTIDPDTTGPVPVDVRLDGTWVATALSAGPRSRISAPARFGLNHGFSVVVPAANGTHSVCAYAINQGAGTSDTTLGCSTIVVNHNPRAAVTGIQRGSSHTVVTGYAVDPDMDAPVTITPVLDGLARLPLVAGLPNAAVSASFPGYSGLHGFSVTLPTDASEHTVCFRLANLGAGIDQVGSCQVIATTGAHAPSPIGSLVAVPGNRSADLSWTPAVSQPGPLSAMTIVTTPGYTVTTLAGGATQAHIVGLHNNVVYTFTVSASNALFGPGSTATASATPTLLPPQLSSAPVSTSHYIRNLTGSLGHDAAITRALGRADATANPSNHRYTILLDIGGQDERRGGVLLSATSTFISYPALVGAMKAYADGYAATQRANSPMLLAIGTNNDVDVSGSAGSSWASKVVNPVRSYVAARYAGVEVAGADDIEPGFSASVVQSRSWVSGFLNATSARFVFNGSADGCSWSTQNSNCNNGWRMSDLQWVSGGAAPARTISLPQIYNSIMPYQWKFISLTGVVAGHPKIVFGGPLTEYTACNGGTSCASLTGVVAWAQLWAAISSHPATRQSDMAYSTDLRVN
jgi:hypothetical protein